MAISELDLPGGLKRFGDPSRPQKEYAPEELNYVDADRIVLVADYDARVTPGEQVAEHGLSRISIGEFLGLVVNREKRRGLDGAIVVFEHTVMRDARILILRGGGFPVEEPIPAKGVADLVARFVPDARVAICDREHPIDEVIVHITQIVPAEKLVSLGLASQV